MLFLSIGKIPVQRRYRPKSTFVNFSVLHKRSTYFHGAHLFDLGFQGI